jgi:hypothetical protein
MDVRQYSSIYLSAYYCITFHLSVAYVNQLRAGGVVALRGAVQR